MARLLVVLALLASPALAAEFAGCLPEDTLVYVETDSPRATTDRVARSEVLHPERRSAEALRERIGTQLARWTGSGWARLFLSLRTVKRVRFAYIEGGGGRRARYVLSFDLGEAAPMVEISTRRLAEGLETTVHRGRACLVFSDSRSQPVHGAFLDGQFVVGVGSGALADFIDALEDGLPGSLAANEAFARVAREHGGRPLWGYVRLELADRGMGEDFESLARLADLVALGFSDEPAGDRSRLTLYHAPGQPLARLIDARTPAADLLRWIPSEPRWALATEIPEPDARWEAIRDLLVRAEEAGFGTTLVRERVEAVESALGIELDDALAAAGGGCVLLLSGRETSRSALTNFSVVLALEDRRAMEDVLARAFERGALFRDLPAGAMQAEAYRGFALWRVDGPGQEPLGWAIDDRHLVFCGNAADLRPLIDRHAGAGAPAVPGGARMVQVASPAALLRSLGALEAASGVAPGRPVRLALDQREDRVEVSVDAPLAALVALALQEPERFFDARTWRRHAADLLAWMGLAG